MVRIHAGQFLPNEQAASLDQLYTGEFAERRLIRELDQPMNSVLEQIGACQLVPVIVLHETAHAAPLAEALLTGGLPCAEVTFRTPAAAESIRIMAQRPDLLVGAGTVLTVEQVKQALDNGARYIVSPGFFPKVVTYCVEHRIPVLPGVATPTEIGLALEFGLPAVKFFPAEANGGIRALKAVSAPFGNAMRYVPTGGISEANLEPYLTFPRVLACGGSWMVPDDLIKGGRFAEVTELVCNSVALARRFSS